MELKQEIRETVNVEYQESVLDILVETDIPEGEFIPTESETDLAIRATANFMDSKKGELQERVVKVMEDNKDKLGGLTKEEREKEIEKIALETCEEYYQELLANTEKYILDNLEYLLKERKRRINALNAPMNDSNTQDDKSIEETPEKPLVEVSDGLNTIVDDIKIDDNQFSKFEVWRDGRYIWEDGRPNLKLVEDEDKLGCYADEFYMDAKDKKPLGLDLQMRGMSNNEFPDDNTFAEKIFKQSFIFRVEVQNILNMEDELKSRVKKEIEIDSNDNLVSQQKTIKSEIDGVKIEYIDDENKTIVKINNLDLTEEEKEQATYGTKTLDSIIKDREVKEEEYEANLNSLLGM